MIRRIALALLLAVLVGAPVSAQNHQLAIDDVLLDAQSTDETTACVAVNAYRHLAVFTEWSAGVSAGVVEIEDRTSSAGNPSSIATHTTPGASTTQVLHFEGVYRTVCTRIETAVSGGTVTTTIIGW